MTLEEYKESIRKYRGSLKSVDKEMEIIYYQGCKELITWSLSNKIIGIHKIANVADMDFKEQHKFLDWINVKRRTINEINVKLLELM